MVCRVCAYEYCWECSGSWENKHYEKVHQVKTVPVSVPGHPTPLRVTQTPHTLYKFGETKQKESLTIQGTGKNKDLSSRQIKFLGK